MRGLCSVLGIAAWVLAGAACSSSPQLSAGAPDSTLTPTIMESSTTVASTTPGPPTTATPTVHHVGDTIVLSAGPHNITPPMHITLLKTIDPADAVGKPTA